MTYVKHADAYEVGWQDSSPDAYVVTDPPFGVRKIYAGKRETRSFLEHLELVLSIPAKAHLVRAPLLRLADLGAAGLRPLRIVAECRTFGISMHPSPMSWRWTPWLVYGRLQQIAHLPDWLLVGPSHNGRADAVGYPVARDWNDHPGITPTQAVAGIVERCVPRGSLVVDPFAGKGNIGVVALMSGRGYFGTEQVEQYAQIAEQRCQHAAAAVQTEAWQPETFHQTTMDGAAPGSDSRLLEPTRLLLSAERPPLSAPDG